MTIKNCLLRFALVAFVVATILQSCSKDDVSSNPIIDDPEPDPDPEIVSIIQNIKSDSIRNYVQMLEDMGTRFALAPNRKAVALAIMHKFESFGIENVALDSFQLQEYYERVQYTTWQYNVIATIPGAVTPDSVYIIGGHHDCIVPSIDDPFTTAPGANDNASGVATTLEIARVLKLVNFTPKSTIKFITFAAEELGLYGSWHYAGSASGSNEKIKMMLNNDMVAYWSLPDTSNWCVNIIDYSNSMALRVQAQQVCSTYTSLKTNNDNTYRAYSDSYPFAEYNYKALFFISNDDDVNYHTLSDLTTACNFKFCREVAKVNCVLLVQNNSAN